MSGSDLECIDSKQIVIISGEGTGPGTIEEYTGKRTVRAIKSRLTRERCYGERWARAIARHGENDMFGQAVGVNVETGELITFPQA